MKKSAPSEDPVVILGRVLDGLSEDIDGFEDAEQRAQSSLPHFRQHRETLNTRWSTIEEAICCMQAESLEGAIVQLRVLTTAVDWRTGEGAQDERYETCRKSAIYSVMNVISARAGMDVSALPCGFFAPASHSPFASPSIVEAEIETIERDRAAERARAMA